MAVPCSAGEYQKHDESWNVLSNDQSSHLGASHGLSLQHTPGTVMPDSVFFSLELDQPKHTSKATPPVPQRLAERVPPRGRPCGPRRSARPGWMPLKNLASGDAFAEAKPELNVPWRERTRWHEMAQAQRSVVDHGGSI